MRAPLTLPGFQPDPVVAKLPSSVQVYVVGGAVRDALLGRSSSDKDWVVVGATVDDLLQAGFKPVGADFPVFLHPVTQEEYALARTERKSGHGYKGFTFHADPRVNLEDDLARRDFTINAMAMSAQGDLIDPFGGFQDLEKKLMRHVSPAFTEDPLRVLRLARFLARFLDFSVAKETFELCRKLRESGELKHLVAERIYSEFNKGMGEEKPSRMIKLISKLGAWSELSGTCPVPFSTFAELDFDRLDNLKSAEDRWVYSLGFFLNVPQIKALSKAWRLPRSTEDLSILASQFLLFLQSEQIDSVSFSQFFNQVDLYRKPARLQYVNQLFENMLGKNSKHVFVKIAVLEVEQGRYTRFVGDKIVTAQSEQAAARVAEVAAQARQEWINGLHAEHFR